MTTRRDACTHLNRLDVLRSATAAGLLPTLSQGAVPQQHPDQA
jgi:hypothetical protein